jgi:tetratricopeptide (TPR) repeat protein
MLASHSEVGGKTDGIPAMLARTFQSNTRPRAEAVERLIPQLLGSEAERREDAIGLIQLSLPGEAAPEGSGLEAHFSSIAERIALLTRYLHARTRDQPLILWLDEFHQAAESLSLISHLLNTSDAGPVLLIGTVPAEKNTAGSDLEAHLEPILTHPNTNRIDLKPLSREGQVDLIRAVLGLEPALAAQVEAQSGGNPQFAVQLVASWVERGLLVPGKRGFELKPGSDASIPAEMIDVWKTRLDAILSQRDEEDFYPIEIAAIFGNQVHRGEWRDALEAAGLATPDSLMSELMRNRLVVRDNQHSDWSFVHGLLRAAVLDHVEAGGRTKQWSSLAADVIAARRDDIPRRARLLVAADRTEEALLPLAAAVSKLHTAGEYGRAKEINTIRTSILVDFDVDPNGLHALKTRFIEILLLPPVNRNDAFVTEGDSLMTWARRLEEWDTLAHVSMRLGACHAYLGNIDRAKVLLNEALEIALEHRLPRTTDILNRLCFVGIRSGDIQAAFEHARASGLMAEAQGNTLGVANSYAMMSRTRWQAGDLAAAEFFLEEATIRFERFGSRQGLAEAANTRGELARTRGDLEAAENAYIEACARYRSIGSNSGMFPQLNLGMTYLLAAKFSQARATLDMVETAFEKGDRKAALLVIRLAKTRCLVESSEWAEVERSLREIGPSLIKLGLRETDFATAATQTAEACEAAGKPDLAHLAWGIAHNQWSEMSRESEARATAERWEQTRPKK